MNQYPTMKSGQGIQQEDCIKKCVFCTKPNPPDKRVDIYYFPQGFDLKEGTMCKAHLNWFVPKLQRVEVL